jgi:hypothetical protein
VIGVRFELNDPYICVIGKLVENRKKDDNGQPKRKPISILGGDADFEYDNEDEE